MTVPPISSIANAIGKAAAGKPWVVADDGGYGSGVQEDTEKTKVLDEMRSAMARNQIQNANSVFFDWEKREVKVSDSTKDIAVCVSFSICDWILNSVLCRRNLPRCMDTILPKKF